MRTSLFTLFLVIASNIFSYAQTIEIANLEKAAEEYLSQNGFSGTILVAQNGNAIFQKSFGMADYLDAVPIQNDFHFSIASVTKLFTAIRVLQLVEAGELELDRPLVEYLPSFQKRISMKVTLHHLLLHISGLPNEMDIHYRQFYTPNGIMDEALKTGKKNALNQFNYNNMDYVALGLVIEKVTKNSWDENIRNHILSPLKMSETGFLGYANYPDQFAFSHTYDNDEVEKDNLFYIENYYAAGNMYSSATDLLKLDQALYTGKLLNDESIAILGKSYPEYNYAGYGVWNYRYPFVEKQPLIMERRGGILGTNVVLVRLLEENFTIIILSNDNRFNPDSFGDANNLRERLIRALF